MHAQTRIDNRFGARTLTTLVPQVLVVAPAFEAKTLKELPEYARANPGRLNYGNGGNGSSNRLGVELMASLAGVSLTPVPYKGDAQAMTDVMSGQEALTLPTEVAATPHIESGKLRALAVSASCTPSLRGSSDCRTFRKSCLALAPRFRPRGRENFRLSCRPKSANGMGSPSAQVFGWSEAGSHTLGGRRYKNKNVCKVSNMHTKTVSKSTAAML